MAALRRYPAMVLLPFFAFPALAEYFKRHYALHSSKLEPAHLKDCETLTNYIQVRCCRGNENAARVVFIAGRRSPSGLRLTIPIC